MTRLIDADELKKRIEYGQGLVEFTANQIEELLEVIDEAPTIERPHGEWKYESYGQYLSTYKCSNCGFHGDKQWICCPYCGTDMRGKNDE